MPLYEYECIEHGVFEAHRAMSDFASPGICPDCRHAAPRILSPPRLSCTGQSDRIARDRNERSRHEPRVVDKESAPRQSSALPRSPSRGRPWALGHG
jgi:putative FmdB family regulatory protein